MTSPPIELTPSTDGTSRAGGDNTPLLTIRDLRTSFTGDSGPVTVVDDVSLTIPRGKTIALVGESGCGKSVTALSILRLLPQPPANIDGGRIILDDGPAGRTDLLTLTEREMRSVRGGRIAMIFQEPLTSLNPVFTVGEQIVEAIELHRTVRGRAAWAVAVELLRRVGIPSADRRAKAYPHQLSGGMRQRTMIAMALACEPALLIADEPTTALDVTVQRQILDLLQTLQAELGMSVLLISHDLGVVSHVADETYVMYAGRIVERAPTGELLANPLHPYTRALLACTPRIDGVLDRLAVIPGSVPDPTAYPSGCRFHPRCEVSEQRAGDEGRFARPSSADTGGQVLRRCVETFKEEPSGMPVLREVLPTHQVACWEAEPVASAQKSSHSMSPQKRSIES